MNFSALDWTVLLLYLLASAAFGVLLKGRQRNLDDYFLGGGHMPWWAISLSITATETSTLTFIGAPAMSFDGDLTFLQVALGYCLGKLLVSLILIPAYMKGRLQTAYQLLAERFGARARRFSALIFLVTRSLSDGVRLFATALVLTVVTGLGDLSTVAIIGVVTVVYTFYGGMRAVVWNDVAQLTIYIIGAALAFWLLLERIPGGWEAVTQTASAKFRVFDFEWSWVRPLTFWGGLAGGGFLTFATHGADQMMVQRYLTCGDKRGSQKALLWSGVFVVFQFLLFLLIGILLWVFYQGRVFADTDRVFPTFIVEEMPSGLSGLIIAAIFAAAMSTLSSSLNSLASSSVNDFYRPFFAPGRSDRHYLRVSRSMTLAWAGVLALIALAARGWGSVLETGLTIASVTMGSVLGVFLLGLFDRRAGEASALAGMAGGLLLMLVLKLTTPLAWTWFVLVGTVTTLLIGWGVSLTWAGPRQRE